MSDYLQHQPQKTQSLSSQINLPQCLITTQIFTRLPIKTLTQFKCVSKEWKSIISSPHFAKLHLKFQLSLPNPPQSLFINSDNWSFLKFDYNKYDSGEIVPCENGFDESPRSKEGLFELEMGSDLKEVVENLDEEDCHICVVGSCNGLVCLAFEVGFLYVWNPATRELRKIENPASFRKKETILGFGYVSSIDDYKILSLSQKIGPKKKAKTFCGEKKAHTLTLKGGKWGNVDVGVLDGYNLDMLNSSGVLVEEKVFWRMVNVSRLLCIVGFDLVNESFVEVGSAKWLKSRDFFLCAMGGCLCACLIKGDGGVEISMLKEYGNWGSWVKSHSIGPFWCGDFYCCNLYGFTRAGKVIMDTLEGILFLIDVSGDDQTYVEMLCVSASKDIVHHVESLVSPFGLVEN